MLGHLQRQLESLKQTSECLRIQMVQYVYTVSWAQAEDSKYNTLNLNIHLSGTRSEAPDEASEDRERPGLEVCEGAPHPGMNSLYCGSHTALSNNPSWLCRSTLRN